MTRDLSLFGYDETGRFREVRGTDGAIIELLLEGNPRARRKADRRPPVELVEIGITWVDVLGVDFDGAERGSCLRNATRYILANGGTLMIGRFHNVDQGTNCCHAWVLTDDGQHIDPSGVVSDGIYFGAPDPGNWVTSWAKASL